MCASDNWRNNFTKVSTLHSGASLDNQIKTMKALNKLQSSYDKLHTSHDSLDYAGTPEPPAVKETSRPQKLALDSI